MTKPTITALIDTYNQGRFIEEAIESVLAQDYPQSDFEIIVVDDGSTDDTPLRVKRFGDRIRTIYKQNGGQASALNAGFAAAQGDLIALLDGDDRWLPGKLSATAEALLQEPAAGLAFHPMQYRNEAGGTVTQDGAFRAVSGRVLQSLEATLLYGSVSTSNMVLRRSLVQRLLPIPETMRIYADSYLAYLAIFLGPVAVVQQPLTEYRIHGRNLASEAHRSPEKLQQRLNSFQCALSSVRAWLQQNGWDLKETRTAAFLKRHELVEQMLCFTVQAPGRIEFARYLRSFNRLYAPLWNWKYRTFRHALAGMGFLLGYRAFETARTRYGASGARLREEWIASDALPKPPRMNLGELAGTSK